MDYTKNFFYGDYGKVPENTFQITEEDLEEVKELNSRIEESAYYDDMLVWRSNDNPQIKNEEDLSRLYVVMQFIAMLADISPELQEKYNLQKYDISLLRRLYLEFDYDDNGSFIAMGYKRPFGNSNVLGDVKDEIDRYNGKHPIEDEEEDDNYEYDKENIVLSNFVNFLSDFYKGGFILQWRSFVYENRIHMRTPLSKIFRKKRIEWSNVLLNREFRLHSYLLDWTLDPSELREQKIKTILK